MSSVLGLKARPHTAKVFPFEIVAVTRDDFVEQAALLTRVALLDGFQYPGVGLDPFRRVNERLDVFRKTRAAVAAARVKKRVSDARIRSDAGAHFFYVDVELVAELGDLVHERDLGGKQRVRSVLRHFRFARPHDAGPGRGSARTARRACAAPLAGRSLSQPRMMRSGCMKSWIAAPSFRNSGLLTTSNSIAAPRFSSSDFMMPRIRSAVPTGTVDLVTTIEWRSIRRPSSPATPYTYDMSGEPSADGGVPTAIKKSSDCDAACASDGLKESRPAFHIALQQRLESRFVDRHDARFEHANLGRVGLDAEHACCPFRRNPAAVTSPT